MRDDKRHPAPAVFEETLVDRLLAGDDDAFEELLRTHGGRLLSVARRLLGCEEEARDAVQEALLSAFRSLDGFERGARLSTWLHRIVTNACLMRLRTRRRRGETAIEDVMPRFTDDGWHAEPVAAWIVPPTELAAERQQLRTVVRECIDELPDAYRTVILLRDIEELDTLETSIRLGVSENATKLRLHRARLALRGLIERRLAPTRKTRRRPARLERLSSAA